MEKDARILVTGGEYGFVGRNLCNHLGELGFTHVGRQSGGYADLTDSRCSEYVWNFFKPDYVFHCAGFVRGIAGNMVHQEKAYRINTLININVVAACIEHKVKKIVAMGTVAMYPTGLAVYHEELLQGAHPHASEYGYAMAKHGMLAHLTVSGLDWAMPIATNMYGPHDRFDVEHGHVIPSLVRKFHEGEATVWGDGGQRRDFLYVKDAVRALVMIMEQGHGAINLATGVSDNIALVANVLQDASGHGYEFDISKPVGQTTRSYDVSKLAALGFKSEYTLEQGLRETYAWYEANVATARKR